MFLLKIWMFVAFSSVSASQNEYYPNLPMGEYRIIYEAIRGCPNAKNHEIKLNLHFHKKAKNITEIIGNLTLNVPVYDSLVIQFSLSSWSLMGGWVENPTFLQLDKFCTNLKNIGGKAWSLILDAFHIPTKNCPIPKGIYTTSGFDVRLIDRNNFPKVYFYGKYKIFLMAKYKNNTLVGCGSMDFKLVRPWELPKDE